MSVSEKEVADLLTGITRVHLAIIRGLSQNHPRSAENILRELRAEAGLASREDGSPSLVTLPARYLLDLLEVKPPNATAERETHNPSRTLVERLMLVRRPAGGKRRFA